MNDNHLKNSLSVYVSFDCKTPNKENNWGEFTSSSASQAGK